MSVLRAFIAIDLSDEVVAQLAALLQRLQAQLGDGFVRWQPPHNMHLTLKFLGDVSTNQIDLLANALRTETAQCPPFDVSVGQLGCFPKPAQPRVLWVGVQAPDALFTLQHGIENQLTRLGYPPEDRPFSPHLTLGRVARQATPAEIRQIANLLAQTRVGFLGAFRVGQVHLFRSDLRPSGAVYTRLFTADLSG